MNEILPWTTQTLTSGVGGSGAPHSCAASLRFARCHKKAAQSAAHRVGPRPLVDRYGALIDEFVFYVRRFIMDNPSFAREALVMMVGPRPLVYSQDVDERDRFLCGALYHGSPKLCRQALLVVARRTPVRHPFVSQDGIKKPQRMGPIAA